MGRGGAWTPELPRRTQDATFLHKYGKVLKRSCPSVTTRILFANRFKKLQFHTNFFNSSRLAWLIWRRRKWCRLSISFLSRVRNRKHAQKAACSQAAAKIQPCHTQIRENPTSLKTKFGRRLFDVDHSLQKPSCPQEQTNQHKHNKQTKHMCFLCIHAVSKSQKLTRPCPRP